MLSEIFPVFCVGCGQFNQFLCDECVQSVTVSEKRSREGFEFYCGFSYEGVMASALTNLKEKNQFGYVRVIANQLRKVISLDENTEVLVPPSTKKAFRKRGFDPSYEIAKHAGLNVSKKLKRIKQTEDQQDLDYYARQANLENAFQLTQPGKYILFDDVITTGATIREMKRAVGEVGAEVIGVLALCSTADKGAN